MKKVTILTLMLGYFLFSINLFAQEPGSAEYQMMKKSGQIKQPAQVPTPIGPIPTITPESSSRGGSGFWIPLDNSFTLAMNQNDDASSSLITLPFTFCLYGDNYTSLYINNNGNVSFGQPYSEYVPTGFPVANFAMVAPFWADIDTRGCGNVWYKIETNPKRIIIIWQEVGYFYGHCDKLNSFQVILTDGNDPLIGIGNNVGFAYEDMSWTTGDMDGSGGFGSDAPATVGINKGDGIDYALVGRFDHPGTAYDGAGGNADGVDWLDYKRFAFDACSGNIPAPPSSSIPISDWAIYFAILLIGIAIWFRFKIRIA